ncbi:MAG: 3-hydroxyacyl-[acyl-carrier-protein] dehydratase FabZ, partial [Burkholderiales bacterium]|nr:3-hydroxyacyl-[acyl-carrier-protein] dehydratase FabZ [Burkholderiales bacterium]
MTGGQNDVQEVMRLLPHRYPFLLIDRVLACEAGKEIVALK